MNSHVFISYSRKDDAVMRRIVKYLRAEGIKVWVDNEKLTPGTPVWEREIEKAIKGASAAIVILSPDAKESVWVLNELTLVDEYQKRVFPVLVRGDHRDSVPLRLVTRQFVNLQNNEKDGLESLHTALSTYLEEIEAAEKAAREAQEKAEVEKIAKNEAKLIIAPKAEADRGKFIPTILSGSNSIDKRLANEHAYLAQTAIMAEKDRIRIRSIYFFTVLFLYAVLYGMQLFDVDYVTQSVKLLLGGFFLLLTLLGSSTVMQLARLQSAWYESTKAMNQLKDSAIKLNSKVSEALQFRPLPARYKLNSLSTYMAIEVAFLSGIMFSTTLFFLQNAFFPMRLLNWVISIILGFLTAALQFQIYKRFLT